MTLCWMNGSFLPAEELRISPFDHGFLYGLGFFETFRTYQGSVPFFSEHYKRLCDALNLYRIEMPYTLVELEAIVIELTEKANGEDGYFRLNVSAGAHDIGLQPTNYKDPTVIVFRKALPLRKRGQAKVAKWLETSRNMPEQAVRMKSHHYGNNVLGRFEVQSLAEEEGFFLTSRGLIAEGVTSNIFFVKDDILYTPSIETGILPGITREWVIRIAEHLGFRVEEGLFKPREMREASECFITNSIQELVPIAHIESNRYLGEDGPVYNRFHQAYIEEILSKLKRS